MKLLAAPALFLLGLLTACAGDRVPRVSPAEAAAQVQSGAAVLVDVREPAEWAATGVAAPAALLAKSDFDGAKKDWAPFLAAHRDRKIILYCRSGNRSGQVAAALAAQGYTVANGGAFKDWAAAGLPVRQPGEPSR